jgi:hypothetical protein
MPAKRFAVEQIIAKLREAEKLQAEGLTIPQTCEDRLTAAVSTPIPSADGLQRDL